MTAFLENSTSLENSTLSNSPEATICIPFSKEDSVSIKVIKAACYTVLMLFSFFGNAAVVAIVAKHKHMRTTTNYLIVNMAVSDLLLSAFAVPRELAEVFIGFRGWLFNGLFGAVLCKIVYFFQDISTAVSIQSIVVITLDRYTGIVSPFRKPIITPRRLKFVIGLIWLISMGLHGIYFYIARTERVKGSEDGLSICFFSFEPAFNTLSGLRINFVILSIVLIAIPLAVIIILYSIMLRDLKREKPFLKSSSSFLKSRRKEDTKIIWNVIAIILLFLICILPINIVGFLYFFAWHKNIPCGVDHLSFAAKFIFYSNASLNPWVYFILHDRYRQGMRNIVKGYECLARKLKENGGIEMKTF